MLITLACNPYSLAYMKEVMDCGTAACKKKLTMILETTTTKKKKIKEEEASIEDREKMI